MRESVRRGRQPPDGARRQRRLDRAQSLVEFALVLPVLLILALAAVDYGRAYFDYISVTNAARNGAVFASASEEAAADEAGIRSAVLNELGEVQDGDSVVVTVATGSDAQGKTFANVTVRHTFRTVFSWPGLPTSFPIQRSVQMRVAQ
jgi:Flp pilus assembly protein TadG